MSNAEQEQKQTQSCGTCKYATFRMTAHKPPRFVKDASTHCKWTPPKEWQIPVSVGGWNGGQHSLASMLKASYVTPEMGADCKCWEPKA